jgi:hypothetical protein
MSWRPRGVVEVQFCSLFKLIARLGVADQRHTPTALHSTISILHWRKMCGYTHKMCDYRHKMCGYRHKMCGYRHIMCGYRHKMCGYRQNLIHDSSSIGLTIPDAARACTVLCSWRWAEEPPETCRAIYRNKWIEITLHLVSCTSERYNSVVWKKKHRAERRYTHSIFLITQLYVTVQRTDKNKSTLRSLHARKRKVYSLWSPGEFVERSPTCYCT